MGPISTDSVEKVTAVFVPKAFLGNGAFQRKGTMQKHKCHAELLLKTRCGAAPCAASYFSCKKAH